MAYTYEQNVAFPLKDTPDNNEFLNISLYFSPGGQPINGNSDHKGMYLSITTHKIEDGWKRSARFADITGNAFITGNIHVHTMARKSAKVAENVSRAFNMEEVKDLVMAGDTNALRTYALGWEKRLEDLKPKVEKPIYIAFPRGSEESEGFSKRIEKFKGISSCVLMQKSKVPKKFKNMSEKLSDKTDRKLDIFKISSNRDIDIKNFPPFSLVMGRDKKILPLRKGRDFLSLIEFSNSMHSEILVRTGKGESLKDIVSGLRNTDFQFTDKEGTTPETSDRIIAAMKNNMADKIEHVGENSDEDVPPNMSKDRVIANAKKAYIKDEWIPIKKFITDLDRPDIWDEKKLEDSLLEIFRKGIKLSKDKNIPGTEVAQRFVDIISNVTSIQSLVYIDPIIRKEADEIIYSIVCDLKRIYPSINIKEKIKSSEFDKIMTDKMVPFVFGLVSKKGGDPVYTQEDILMGIRSGAFLMLDRNKIDISSTMPKEGFLLRKTEPSEVLNIAWFNIDGIDFATELVKNVNAAGFTTYSLNDEDIKEVRQAVENKKLAVAGFKGELQGFFFKTKEEEGVPSFVQIAEGKVSGFLDWGEESIEDIESFQDMEITVIGENNKEMTFIPSKMNKDIEKELKTLLGNKLEPDYNGKFVDIETIIPSILQDEDNASELNGPKI